MFAGEMVNPTEARAALHTALRTTDVNVPHFARIDNERRKMAAFARKIRAHRLTGYTGKPIRHIVNIGIGGSDLGPKMVCDALQHLGDPALSLYFVSNIDGVQLERVLAQIDPQTTLAIVVSKTFTTLETLTNAHTLRRWFLAQGVPDAELVRHFAGVSANPEAVRQFGIQPDHFFQLWDWIGGRYSLWSAAGLAIMVAIGPDCFDDLLAGAANMDQHFCEAPLAHNLPVILGLIGIWYRNFFSTPGQAIVPYTHALRYFPAYLQQLEMESNGKSTRIDGAAVDYQTTSILWGETGTNAQHAFFQMLHQGTDLVPVDFIAVLKPPHQWPDHHTKLLAQCFAQSEALMLGRSTHAASQLAGSGRPGLAPHLTFPGNRPSNTILLDALTPSQLGALIALYEHKTFVQAAVWQINPFDQWGVGLGKQLGAPIEDALQAKTVVGGQHDSSTVALIARAREKLKTG
jgi:glucose-6-phosphate isomerase